MTTENSRADALTEKQRHAVDEAAKVLRDNWEHGTAEDLLMAFLPESSDPQPAAAPIDELKCTCGMTMGHTRTCAAFDESMMRTDPLAPSPPDERAVHALDCQYILDDNPWAICTCGKGSPNNPRAASASETGAEGAKLTRYAPGIALDKVRGGDVAVMYSRADGEYVKLSDVLRSPAMATEAVAISDHDLSTSAGGLGYIAEFFAKRLRRHDFGRYIHERLAADFACALAQYLRDRDAAPPPAQADARVGLTAQGSTIIDALKQAGLFLKDYEPETIRSVIQDLLKRAAHPGQPEPRAEVTNPFRELLAALIDIYDDERNNAPEDRCYVEGAWSEVLGEARALLAPLPDPAQVAAESPDWVKNALPPEGA